MISQEILDIPQRLIDLAKKYHVNVIRHPFPLHEGRNRGECTGENIFLGLFDDIDIEPVAFFHELGHVLMNRQCKRGQSMCTLSREGMAWELGMEAAFGEGFVWEYQSKQMAWARAQLKTYARAHN